MRRVGRIASAAVCVEFWISGVLLLVSGAHTADRIGGGVFLLAAPVGLWLFVLRPFVTLTRGRVFVQNPLRKLSIPLGAVMGAHAGYGGLSLNVRGRRRPVTAWAVQMVNWSTWPGRESRADRAAAEIVAAAYAPDIEPVTDRGPR